MSDLALYKALKRRLRKMEARIMAAIDDRLAELQGAIDGAKAKISEDVQHQADQIAALRQQIADLEAQRGTLTPEQDALLTGLIEQVKQIDPDPDFPAPAPPEPAPEG